MPSYLRFYIKRADQGVPHFRNYFKKNCFKAMFLKNDS